MLERKTIQQTIVKEVQASNSHVVIGIALLAVVLIISPVIIILVRMITRTLQVISLINVLYKMFDSRIDCYDVYKIETIGDAYMVASGLHMREEGKDHAEEIAAMAIDLLHGTENFVIPHMPGERLKIRIGIHTGPAVAAFKIHISQDTKDCLDRVGGFIVKLRGELEVKGRGVMDTYWLTGKHGVLPDRRRYSTKEDDLEFMADNPHSEGARFSKDDDAFLQASFFRRTFDICKKFLG
ncbi:hypothetical protein Pcinc_039473 [Petrolisthes cinctipes]|uniref:Guanylate cyclase domain-containing protein n=1 Tax=Petrolisthes cinctipes TaxID=88211 RepID=A0AAE1BNX0_PETCI|nr:hypothetical protein Pcinc_039473 [Petrolisthes cinctipes]